MAGYTDLNLVLEIGNSDPFRVLCFLFLVLALSTEA